MALQIKQFTPSNHLLKAMIYGKSGSGKTTIGSTAPRPLFICSENGLASIANKAPEYVEVSSLDDLKNVYEELRKGLDYDSVVIDSLSEIAKVIKEKLTDSNKFDMDMRKRGKYGETMMQIIRDIIKLPYNVICIIHDKTIVDDDGKIKMIDIAVQGSAKEEIPRYFDVIGYTYIKDGINQITVKQSDSLLTKDRLNCLPENPPLDIQEWIEIFKKSVEVGEIKVVKELEERNIFTDAGMGHIKKDVEKTLKVYATLDEKGQNDAKLKLKTSEKYNDAEKDFIFSLLNDTV